MCSPLENVPAKNVCSRNVIGFSELKKPAEHHAQVGDGRINVKVNAPFDEFFGRWVSGFRGWSG